MSNPITKKVCDELSNLYGLFTHHFINCQRLVEDDIIPLIDGLPVEIASDRAKLVTALNGAFKPVDPFQRLIYVYEALNMAISWFSDFQHEARLLDCPDADIVIDTLNRAKRAMLHQTSLLNGPDHVCSHGPYYGYTAKFKQELGDSGNY